MKTDVLSGVQTVFGVSGTNVLLRWAAIAVCGAGLLSLAGCCDGVNSTFCVQMRAIEAQLITQADNCCALQNQSPSTDQSRQSAQKCFEDLATMWGKLNAPQQPSGLTLIGQLLQACRDEDWKKFKEILEEIRKIVPFKIPVGSQQTAKVIRGQSRLTLENSFALFLPSETMLVDAVALRNTNLKPESIKPLYVGTRPLLASAAGKAIVAAAGNPTDQTFSSMWMQALPDGSNLVGAVVPGITNGTELPVVAYDFAERSNLNGMTQFGLLDLPFTGSMSVSTVFPDGDKQMALLSDARMAFYVGRVAVRMQLDTTCPFNEVEFDATTGTGTIRALLVVSMYVDKTEMPSAFSELWLEFPFHSWLTADGTLGALTFSAAGPQSGSTLFPGSKRAQSVLLAIDTAPSVDTPYTHDCSEVTVPGYPDTSETVKMSRYALSQRKLFRAIAPWCWSE